MKHLYYLFLFFNISIFSQESVDTEFLNEKELIADTLISVDNFGTTYYLKNDVFHKSTHHYTLSYNNLQLGEVYSVNAFNPLKINLFYQDFNTVVLLDNRLAEVFKVDFNTLSPYRNITHVTTGHDNTIWVFNQNLQKLELFDYKTQTTRAQTVPIESKVLDLKSNYNYCWLLTENYLYTYNYFGSLIKRIKNTGFTSFIASNENIILKRENALYYLKNNSEKITPISTPNLLINQFFVTNETLYIYNSKVLKKYQLKIK